MDEVDSNVLDIVPDLMITATIIFFQVTST